MKLSSREAVLACLTSLAILVGLTYWLINPRIEEWNRVSDKIKLARNKTQRDQRLLDQRGDWEARMEKLREKLTRYPKDKDVTADYLKLIERLAKENGLTLVQRRPEKEKTEGGLYELTINCTWESDLKALVRFLYTLENQNVTMDVGELTISTMPGKKERLKGNFALVCAYTRQEEEPEQPDE